MYVVQLTLLYAADIRYLLVLSSQHDFRDDADIDTEIRNMFFRANMLVRKFGKCTTAVKITLFKSYVLTCMIRLCGTTTLAELLTVYTLATISA